MIPIKRVLITGGTGSFGKALTAKLLHDNPNIERLVIFSRDELKQWEMSNLFPQDKYPNLRFFLGDIRDQDRIRRALEGIEIVVHAAALKQVPAAEYNPIEFINTNVLGANNLIQACLDSDVKRVIALSTDKASAPINLYGATKLCSDKLFIAANNILGSRDLRFSVVRYGNVMGSRGSVIPFFLEQVKKKILPITDPRMTRFNILLEDGVDLVIWAIEECLGGEIVIPKLASYRISDLVEAIGPNCQKNIIGRRPGEKLHEEMISSSESISTIEMNKKYLILDKQQKSYKKYMNLDLKTNFVKEGFNYTSFNNDKFLTVDELRNLIKDKIDSSFSPY